MAEIGDILVAHRLPPRLDYRSMPLNPWFALCEQEGIGLSAHGLSPARVQFCFYESAGIQAVAIQEPGNLAAMSAGMFSMLCRLSATITSKGIMPSMGRTLGPNWQPDISNSILPVRDLLDPTVPFDWLVESAGWVDDPERSTLFYFLLSTMFRFVVVHELGHIAYDHPRRRRVQSAASMFADGDIQTLLTPTEALPSQAREAAADAFAFRRLLEILDRELLIKKDHTVAKIVRAYLAPDNIALASYALTALYLYFRMSDRADWIAVPLDTLSHPPAPFRLKLLCAHLIENSFLGVREPDALAAVRKAVISGDAIMSVALNSFPNPQWFEALESKAFDDHFAVLSQEVPQWLRPLIVQAPHR